MCGLPVVWPCTARRASRELTGSWGFPYPPSSRIIFNQSNLSVFRAQILTSRLCPSRFNAQDNRFHVNEHGSKRVSRLCCERSWDSSRFARKNVIFLTFFLRLSVSAMGCSSSAPVKKESSSNYDFSRRNTIVTRPDVPVEIGGSVKKLDEKNRVVFIFGKFLPFNYIYVLFLW